MGTGWLKIVKGAVVVSLLAGGMGTIGALSVGLTSSGVASAAGPVVSGVYTCLAPLLGKVKIQTTIQDLNTIPATLRDGTTYTVDPLVKLTVGAGLIKAGHTAEKTLTSLTIGTVTAHITKVGFTGPTEINANNTPIQVPINTTTEHHGFIATLDFPTTQFTVDTASGTITITPGNVTADVVLPLTCYSPGHVVTLHQYTTTGTLKTTTTYTTHPPVITGENTNGPIDSATATKAAAVPTVTSFTPTAGPTGGGTTVVITGTNLTGATAVKFGTTTAASFHVTSSTTIKATTKPHAAGTVHVSVTTPGGTGTSSGSFTFVTAPTVTSFTPAAGPTGGGTMVTIKGTNFTGTGYTTSSVKFGTTTAASFHVTSSTTIKATTKPHAAGTVKVSVTTPGGIGTSSGSFTFVTVPAPTVASFTPATGSTGGGTTVTITGTNFKGTGYTTTSVKFGTTTAASFTVTSSTTIKAVTKAHGLGTVHVSVTNPGGTGTSSGFFTFVTAPSVTSFAPSAGPTGGGTTVIITGKNFTAATSVTFGTTTATSFHVTNPTTIKAVTKAHAAGTVKVSVKTASGTGTSSSSFTFVTAPAVGSFAPSAGPTGGGTTVTITGTNFKGTGYTTTSVKFGTTAAASFTVTSSTTIKAVTKAHVAGTVHISVTTPGGTGTSSGSFTFVTVPPPTVTSFTPTAGPTGGGTTVTITGKNFTGAVYTTTSVKFGSTTAATFKVTNPTTITAKTKSHVAGTVHISVTTPGGTGTSTGSFTFVAAPIVTSLIPTAGPTGGGTTVTIRGTHFTGTGYTTSSVKFGTVTATTFTVTSSTTITAKTKGHAAGTVHVSVTTPGGTGASGGLFTFVAAPTVGSFTPAAGLTSGGAIVTIKGTNFTGTGYATTSVKFGTTTAASFHVTSSTTITATTKAHAVGTVHVSVTTPGGTGTSSGSFTFVTVPTPTVTSFTPGAGPASGGTTVTITGTNFTGTAYTTTSVRFGTTTAATFTVTSSTTITAKTKAHAAGTVNVSVTTPGGTATSATGFTFVAAPTISKVTPAKGPEVGGTTVTITGANFTTVTAVKFGTTTGTSITVKSSTMVTVKDPSGTAGTVNVSVTTSIGGTGTLSSAFTYEAPPPPPTSATGYWAAAGDGEVFSFGTARYKGSQDDKTLNAPIVGMAATPTGSGYWLVASDGGVFSFGSARYFGSEGGSHLNEAIVGMAAAPTGLGYWLVAADGGVFSFGSAKYHGSEGGAVLTAPVVGIAAAPTGNGYWLVAADGGVFSFGSIRYHGSEGGKTLAAPVVGIAATPTGSGGYWLVAADGGVFSFGSAQSYGSEGGKTLAAPVVGIATAPTGSGYWLVGADGGVFSFGSARFHGSLADPHLTEPVVGIVGS